MSEEAKKEFENARLERLSRDETNKILDAFREHVRDEIDEMANRKVKRGALMEAVKEDLTKVAREKEEVLLKLRDVVENSDNKEVAIRKVLDDFKLKMDEKAAMIKALTNTVSDIGKLTEEVVYKMAEKKNLGNMIHRIQEAWERSDSAKGLRNALKWSLGMSVENQSSAAYKAKAFNTLRYSLTVSGDPSAGIEAVGWIIAGFMDVSDQSVLMYKFIKENNLSAKQTRQFLDKANGMGVANNVMYEALLERRLGELENDGTVLEEDSQKIMAQARRKEKRKQRTVLYDDQSYKSDMYRESLTMGRSPYGSSNAAGDMMNLKNLGIFLGKAAAVTTITMNTAVGIFQAGRLKKPSLILKAVTNKYNLLAGAGLYGLHVLESDKDIEEVLASGGDVEAVDRLKAKALLKSSPGGWKEVFTSDGEYHGIKAFTEWVRVQQKIHAPNGGKIDKENLHLENFMNWLYDNRTDQNHYEEILNDIEDIVPDKMQFALLANATITQGYIASNAADKYKKALTSSDDLNIAIDNAGALIES